MAGGDGASLGLNLLNVHNYISIALDPVDRRLIVECGDVVGRRRNPSVRAKLNRPTRITISDSDMVRLNLTKNYRPVIRIHKIRY